ncbi:MAG: YebC/PmpR family DNA-binding transcriptional regulator [Kiritimatiellae bacterium]|nr:YebC/PmpR family DNA-binding transcriptional regulator [Kiritimatiellia bacterium]MDW8458640.1 YebC/PmpR family DNA-binding transcriptional regulator [Verrucomicrobiota bacterium]
MAGHSKWANIKHRKAAADAAKGRIFSKIAKEIMVAARHGGGDPAANITLRALIQKARGVNMPADNIERAIKRGTGELEGQALEEIYYEGYGPGGISIVVHTLSDNRNRTASEVRNVFSKHGGSLAGSGSVLRNFRRRGYFTIAAANVSEDRLLEIALEAGADDVKRDGEMFEVICEPARFGAVSDALNAAGIKPETSEITMLPETTLPVTDPDKARQILTFIEALEEMDDVQNVYANFDIADDVMARAQG